MPFIEYQECVRRLREQRAEPCEQPLLRAEEFRRRVVEGLGDYSRFSDGGQALEAWDSRERVSKYIVNSVRAYEFWGYDWWVPFWDAEFRTQMTSQGLEIVDIPYGTVGSRLHHAMKSLRAARKP